MKQQMRLNNFSEAFDIPRDTIMDWIDKEKGFAGKVAFKNNSRWYIDIPAFTKWRERKHRESYKYA